MKNTFRSLMYLLLSIVLFSCAKTATDNNFYTYQVNHEISQLKSAVASAHPLASQAGAWALKEGGNAYDAAIVTQLALAVVYPSAGNLGGGGFLLARDKDGKLRMLDFREKAPLKSTKDMFIDKDGTVSIDKQEGIRAAGIPGTIDGIYQLLPYAKLPVEKLFEPAIALAKYGFCITEKQAGLMNETQDKFRKYSTPTCPFIKDQWKAGDTLRQLKLATTLENISKKGRDEFYKGSVAQSLVKQSEQSGGIFTMEDFAKYQSKWREPITFTYKDYTMIVPSLPSSGGILLAQMFTMIAPYTANGAFDKQSIQTVQVMTEAEKRAFADRAKYMGDPDFYHAPAQGMLDKTYIESKMKDFVLNSKAVPVSKLNLPMPKESEETTHISIVDKEGNAISITTTLNGNYGSYVWAEEVGFFLNNEMDDFSAKAGTSNMYGAVEGEGNSIVPEKRMLSSMTPTIVLKAGKLKYVVGAPGGTTIPTSVFQTLVNLIEYKLTAKDAVFNPRFHHQYLPDEITLEASFPSPIKDSLLKLGYALKERESWGRVELIAVDESTNTLTAVGDVRGDDSPDGEK